MLPGECLMADAPSVCPNCQQVPRTSIHREDRGSWVQTWCDCGPYSRETDYLPSHEHAEAFLSAFQAHQNGQVLTKDQEVILRLYRRR